MEQSLLEPEREPFAFAWLLGKSVWRNQILFKWKSLQRPFIEPKVKSASWIEPEIGPFRGCYCKDGGGSGRRKPSMVWVRVCSTDNNCICFKALTVIYSRINLYLEVALLGLIWNNTFIITLSIHVSNVCNRKRLWIINNSVHAYASCGGRECKCLDVRKWLRVWSEYSRHRVRSPLVDLTAQHKKSVLVIGLLHWTRLTVTDVWWVDYWVKRTPR